MYIKRKIYSSYIDEFGEEKLFSTTELIYEETYQKEFAFRDYEGLDEIGKENLKKARKEIADNLRAKRNKSNEMFESRLKNLKDNHEFGRITNIDPANNKIYEKAAKSMRDVDHISNANAARIAGIDARLKEQKRMSEEEYLKTLEKIGEKARQRRKNEIIAAASLGTAALASGGTYIYLKNKYLKKNKKKEQESQK